LKGEQNIPEIRRTPKLKVVNPPERNKPVRNRRITYTILTGIAVTFAVIAGLSTVAWLLPSMFRSLGEFLIRTTGNQDIALNVGRISRDPIAYAIGFALLGLATKWLANKF